MRAGRGGEVAGEREVRSGRQEDRALFQEIWQETGIKPEEERSSKGR